MKTVPDKKQLQFMDWEFGIFFHFGIRTFYPGHHDWDGIEMPAEKFNPVELDCENWIKAAKEAGAKYAVLTAKHHDGFALWPSKYSRYSVRNTPWKAGKGDVVREYVNACRKYGLKVGLYYSPAQWGEKVIRFKNDREYDDYFVNQIHELLTDYGKIDYLWFDSCGSENHSYDKKRIVGEIFRLQPGILTFCDPEWAPGVKWAGNEDGYISLKNDLVAKSWDFSELSETSVCLAVAQFLPSECDCKIRATWFFDENEETLKSVDELFGMYEMTVGHGANFLLNIGPSVTGKLPPADKKRLAELGNKIKKNYSCPLPFGKLVQESENSFSIVHKEFASDFFEKNTPFPLVNTVKISEDITDGQSIESFRIYAYLPHYTHKKILIFNGCTVGHKILCRFSAIRTPKITVEICSSNGKFLLNDMQAYYVH